MFEGAARIAFVLEPKSETNSRFLLVADEIDVIFRWLESPC